MERIVRENGKLKVMFSTREPAGESYLCPANITQENVDLIDIVDGAPEINASRQAAKLASKAIDDQAESTAKNNRQACIDRLKAIDETTVADPMLKDILLLVRGG